MFGSELHQFQHEDGAVRTRADSLTIPLHCSVALWACLTVFVMQGSQTGPQASLLHYRVPETDAGTVMGESPACTGSDDPPTSVPLCYRDFDLDETVDAKTDSFAAEAEIVNVTGSGLESTSCLEGPIHQEQG